MPQQNPEGLLILLEAVPDRSWVQMKGNEELMSDLDALPNIISKGETPVDEYTAVR